ncbi:hypothetical protein HBI56_164140 [Parastagonospora nodorum]|uniref:Uncharacterized protein n=1 Tax=Phaeosphaeria nodorum (strain SN15 / ATCC MYA-4574 / FGSC 10173) TaxID=321614 RepID=A0A7U2NQC9_PHANO|nr:hypothetical protein HBH56_071920 [Parastagonospora nodorum]QRD06586.1 hypothetical protein JI435_423470 [Parastagonospora nodorum SN15]KAH3927311.1 hypothetical protein HBH54_152150 [Parastagonospora nodorum]KAH3952014.1 hypothetical protein HBH53_056210 [Parastagonospora nodorum]KAH3981917.1 hypothetical protein HBH51_038900 [Parastagonospora nodorum]
MVLSAYRQGPAPDKTRLRHLPSACRKLRDTTSGIVHEAATSNAGSRDADGAVPSSWIRLRSAHLV